jgi:protein-S-isoprenylcysteine O-methyltransferase Ste14
MLAWVAPDATIDSVAGQRVLRGIFAAGAALAIAGAVIRTWATAYLRAEVVHDVHLHSEQLVADGPFRFVRNPLYLGVLLLAVGVAPMMSLSGAVWIFVVLLIFLRRLIGREEHGMLAQLGDSFRRYLDAVPMIFPALRPRLPPAGARPQWGRAILGELFVWIFALASVLLAITLDFRWTGYLCLAGVVIYPLVQRRLMRT